MSATFWPVGEIVNVQVGGGGGGGAACDTVKVCPAIVSVPVRAASVFAATANATVPLPVPDAPPVSVSHGALALAVHAHVFAEAVTATEPDAPVSATFWPVGEIVNVQVRRRRRRLRDGERFPRGRNRGAARTAARVGGDREPDVAAAGPRRSSRHADPRRARRRRPRAAVR